MILNEVEDIRYELFDISELDAMAMMTAEAFVRHEPITSALKISSEDFADLVRLLGPKLIREELSVIARHLETGQIIGAIIADDFAMERPAEIQRLNDKFKPVWAVLDELDTQYKQARILTKGEYLHFSLLAVEHRQTGKNVAENLVRVCIENGIRKGYKTGVVETTGVVSQYIFRKFGFTDRFEAPYKTFTYQGNSIFSSIDRHHGIILMDKVLTQ